MSNPVSRWLAALRHDLSAKVRYRETTACAVGIIAAGSVTKCPFVHESLGCLLWAACSPPPLPPLSSLMPFSSGTRKFGRCARFVGDASTTSLSVHVEGGVASPAYVGEYLIYLPYLTFLPPTRTDSHMTCIQSRKAHLKKEKRFLWRSQATRKVRCEAIEGFRGEKRKLPRRRLLGVIRAVLPLCIPPCSAHFLANFEAAHAVLAPWLLYPQVLVRRREGEREKNKGVSCNGRVCPRLDRNPPFSSCSKPSGAAPWPRALRVSPRENEKNTPEPCECSA